MSKNIHLSIISPIYKSLETIDLLTEKLVFEASKITEEYEIILIDDGNEDSSWRKITKQAELNSKIKGVKLSRNFGQHYAITAGIDYSKGDIVTIIDCDLQQDPIYLNNLYKEILKGYDIVFTQIKKRKHSFVKNLFSNIFYKIFNFLTSDLNNRAEPNQTAFTMFNRKVANEYKKIKDTKRHHLSLLRSIGLKTNTIFIKNRRRQFGKTSYDTKKLITHAIDGILFNTDKMLHLITYSGFLISFISFISIAYIILSFFISGYAVGWASVVVLILFSLGSILSSLGVIGLYIGRTLEQTKQRPLYIVEDKLNIKA